MAFNAGRLSLLDGDTDSDSDSTCSSFLLSRPSLKSVKESAHATPPTNFEAQQNEQKNPAEVDDTNAIKPEPKVHAAYAPSNCIQSMPHSSSALSVPKDSGLHNDTSSFPRHSMSGWVRYLNEHTAFQEENQALRSEVVTLQNEKEDLLFQLSEFAVVNESLKAENTQLAKTLDWVKSEYASERDFNESKINALQNKCHLSNELNADLQMEKENIAKRNQDLLAAKESELLECRNSMIKEITAHLKKNDEIVKKNDVLSTELRVVQAKLSQLVEEKEETISLNRESLERSTSHNEGLRQRNDELIKSSTSLKLELEKYKVKSESKIEEDIKQMKEAFRTCEESLKAKHIEFTKFYKERSEILDTGKEAINIERKNVDRATEDVNKLFDELQNYVDPCKDKLGNCNLKYEEIVSKVLNARDSTLKDMEETMNFHLKQHHKIDEEEKMLKKQVADRKSAFQALLEEFKNKTIEYEKLYENTNNLQQGVLADMATIRDINVTVQTKLNTGKKNKEEQDQQLNVVKPFTEKLCETYWSDEKNPNFTIGLDAHKFVVQKNLEMEEILLKNQCVSLVIISRRGVNDNDEESEVFSQGYGKDGKESFINAVENMKKNRQFMKRRNRGTSVASSE